MSIWGELQRRHVVRVAVAYAVVAWLLVQIAGLVLPAFEAPLWVLQVVIFVLVLGFPVALILAWAFELTPTGIKPTATVDRTHSKPDETGSKLGYIGVGLLIGAVAASAKMWFLTQD